ncbi:MAG: hypothetical protein AAFR11_10055 [Pseudomonadota bacterium]
MAHETQTPDDKGWADKPGFVRLFLYGLYAACGVAALLGFLYPKEKPHFALETLPVFFAIYGFVMFAGIVLIGQHLRKLVAKPEGYYEERE